MKAFYKRPGFWLLLAVLSISIVILQRTQMTNVAETSPQHTDASLKTRRYKTNLRAVKKAVEEIIPQLSTYFRSWRLTESSDESADYALVKAEIPVVIFTDDLQIELKSEGAEETIVGVRSASRIGHSDFGENRRHILQILNALDAKFGSK